MTTTAIIPEILDLDETQVLEDSPMTPAEQRKLVEIEAKIKGKLGDKMAADLAIGQALLQIQRERLYRSAEGGRTFDDYIKQESHRLTPDGQPIGVDTAKYLRGFYYFREEVLGHSRGHGRGNTDLPLPTHARQVRPLIFLLDHLHRDASALQANQATYDARRAAEAKAIEIWKAACTEAGKGKTPTFDQVNRARLADAAAEQHRLRGRSAQPMPAASSSPAPAPSARPAKPHSTPASPPTPPASPAPAPAPAPPAPAPSISALELEKDDTALDAGVECKKLMQAVNDAQRSIETLRAILYSRVNTYGRDYMGFLRQVDAGVYSVTNIDDRIEQMSEDLRFIADLLVADVGEGELAQSTIDVAAIPTRA